MSTKICAGAHTCVEARETQMSKDRAAEAAAAAGAGVAATATTAEGKTKQ